MAQSPEYPDLLWMPPKSWTDANRTAVQLVVIHTTEGSSTHESAEDGAAYDQRRTDGTSTHYFHDDNSTVQCVRSADQAHAARAQGNRRGIQHELCTRAGSANWENAYHQALLRRAAKQAARDAKKWGIPVRHLTVAQVADGIKGFCGHWDITRAFPQDNGTHTDPGTNFPWSQFLDMVRAELAPDEEDDMAGLTDADVTKIWNNDGAVKNPPDRSAPGGEDPGNEYVRAAYAIESMWLDTRAIRATLPTMLKAIMAKDQVDEVALAEALAPGVAAAVLAGIPAGVEVTAEQLKAAVLGALREPAAPSA